MTIFHNSGCYIEESDIIIEKFVYCGVETVTHICPKCDEDMSWVFEPDENYLNFIEHQEEKNGQISECPIKSSNRKNTKPILKVKPKGDFNEH